MYGIKENIYYHGTDKEFDYLKENSCLSSRKDFAKRFGDIILKINFTPKNHFDLDNVKHFNLLLDFIGYRFLIDTYNNKQYYSFKEYKLSYVYSMDNWSIVEQYKYNIKKLGFDSAIIYEGGIQNLMVFDKIYFKEVVKC